ncbi:Anti-silencing protein, ASF1-like protein [Dictyocaulus viviparus]|uniref:Anti-silencing protein, ASF1-like protein n=1 Tax=Dictyocaulus viviparus TaxID=29172 RepID=A0A0D8XY69_DICVI|nr:Anti-silencing protein, ASF1-like protein [Dictyocaulus viviparus]
MASRVNICSVDILDNPSSFTSQFKLEITFEVFEYLPHDLEWELVYVGSAKSSSFDQVLDSVLVGPVPEGRHKFVFAVDAPDPSKIPVQDLVGVTVLLLRCKYNGQEFINLGWFVSNDYEDLELKENPPAKPLIEKLIRTVQTDDLRVTSFPIKWDENQPDEYPPEPDQEELEESNLLPVEEIEDDGEDEEETEENLERDADLEESILNDQVEDIEQDEIDLEVEDDDKAVECEKSYECNDINMGEDTVDTVTNTTAMENTKSDVMKDVDKVDIKEVGDAPFSDVTNEAQVVQ